MRHLKTFSTCLLALALHNGAWAGIYETADAQDDPAFSGSPLGQQAYEDDPRREQAFDRVDPAAPNEVLDAEAPREVGDSDAQMPREVGDFPAEGDAPPPGALD